MEVSVAGMRVECVCVKLCMGVFGCALLRDLCVCAFVYLVRMEVLIYVSLFKRT